MARPGPTPLPVERKRVLGNPGKERLPAPRGFVEPSVVVPSPPKGLRRKATLERWERIWRAGRQWLAPESDAELVTLVCEGFEDREALRRTVRREGWTFRTEKGYVGPHPAVTQLRALEKQLTDWLSLLGFTPADRSRLGLAEVRRISELDAFRQRATARGGGSDVGTRVVDAEDRLGH